MKFVAATFGDHCFPIPAAVSIPSLLSARPAAQPWILSEFGTNAVVSHGPLPHPTGRQARAYSMGAVWQVVLNHCPMLFVGNATSTVAGSVASTVPGWVASLKATWIISTWEEPAGGKIGFASGRRPDEGLGGRGIASRCGLIHESQPWRTKEARCHAPAIQRTRTWPER